MQTENLSAWTHDHVFDTGNALAERSTRVVMWITAAAFGLSILTMAGLRLPGADRPDPDEQPDSVSSS